MVRPSGLARAANRLVPLVDPPPGSLTTTTTGLPGRYFCSSGALKRAQVSEPPPAENGMIHSMVLPAKFVSAAAGPARPKAAAAPSARPIALRRVTLSMSDILSSQISALHRLPCREQRGYLSASLISPPQTGLMATIRANPVENLSKYGIHLCASL